MPAREQQNSGKPNKIIQTHTTYFIKKIEVYLLLKTGFDLHDVLSLTGHQHFCKVSEIGCFNLRNSNRGELSVLHKSI